MSFFDCPGSSSRVPSWPCIGALTREGLAVQHRVDSGKPVIRTGHRQAHDALPGVQPSPTAGGIATSEVGTNRHGAAALPHHGRVPHRQPALSMATGMVLSPLMLWLRLRRTGVTIPSPAGPSRKSDRRAQWSSSSRGSKPRCRKLVRWRSSWRTATASGSPSSPTASRPDSDQRLHPRPARRRLRMHRPRPD